VTSTPVAAAAPATSEPPLSRSATRQASTAANSAAARAIASQTQTAASPSGASSTATATGNGLNAGPSVVSSPRPAISRPQTSHDSGS
jgi:hypothetical protein